MQQIPANVDELEMQGCLYLWALLTAQEQRLPVAPTRRMTLALAVYLQELQIIDIPLNEDHWELKLDVCTTPIEGVPWRLKWAAYERVMLCDALEDYFNGPVLDDSSTAIRLRLWNDLGAAETERYFEKELVRHHFPREWAQDIGYAYRNCNVSMTLAQWRYCAWAATRRGASKAMRFGLSADGLREDIFLELKRRIAAVSSGAWTGASLPPQSPRPESALGRGFSDRLTSLGPAYWNAKPSAEALLDVRSRPSMK